MKRIAILVLLVTAMNIAPAAFAQQTLQQAKNPIVWNINGDPLYAAEISLTMQNLAAQAQQAGGPAPTKEQLMQLATERMIEQKLLVQEAERLAIRVNKERLAAMIGQMEQQSGGRENLERVLAAGGATYEQAANLMRERDLIMQFVDAQIAPTIKISEDDIATYYKENPDLFSAEEQVRARHIIFEVAPDASNDLAEAARLKAGQARAQVLDGEDFAELAKKISEGPSASAGGDLGVFEAKRMVPPFAAALATLKPGEISDVVRTSFGYHVIKLEEIIPAGKRSFDEVHDRIAMLLKQEKVGATLAGLVESLRKNGTIEPVIPAGVDLD